MPIPSGPVIQALTASQRTWTFRYDVLALDATTVKRQVAVEKCSVANNDLADKIKRTCTVELAPGETFDELTEMFRPWALLLLPDGNWYQWSMGTFYLSSGMKRYAARAGDSGRKFVGYDRALVLEEEKILFRYVESAGGVPVTEKVTGHLSWMNRPFEVANVTPSPKVLPAPLEWAPGTTVLKLINDDLAAIGYRPLYFDEMGTPVVEPYVDPAAAPVVWDYVVDSTSVILPNIDTSKDLFNVPNVWLAFVSEPDRPVLASTYTNNNPGSLTSTVNRGREIVEVIQMTQATGEAPPVDQATLDARVLRAAQEASQIWEDVEFTTGLMPFHGTGEVFTLDNGVDGVIRYREHTWEMDLTVGGTMKHRFRRVVAL